MDPKDVEFRNRDRYGVESKASRRDVAERRERAPRGVRVGACG
jgi:hypothetical protein